LGFTFYGYERESELLAELLEKTEWESILKIGKMARDGMSVREIAEQLELPKSTVHRKLHMCERKGA
jgi:DNA-binding MarR family transcriptional regulator